MNTYRNLTRALLIGLGITALTLSARAEDIDIYSGAAGTWVPNVLLVLDSSANWGANIPSPDCYYKDSGVTTTSGPEAKEQGKKMAIEKCALYNVIDALPVKPTGGAVTADNNEYFNIGLMIFNESPAAHSGGYPRQAFLPLTTNNKALFKSVIAGLSISADKGNNAAFAKTMYEAYLYFKGENPYHGTLGTKWDANAVTANNKYVSPSSSACGQNHVIFIANGAPGESTNKQAKVLLANAGGNTAQINYPSSIVSNSDQANWADEFARFMRNADVSSKDGDQGIVTHGVAVTGASGDGLYPNFIRSMANYGGGSYFSASDVDALVEGLLQIFDAMQAVNSIFASASLPVSVNSRGTHENQVFMGMFRPDENGKPRWRGNLKQYKFGIDALGSVQLVDSSGAAAISASSGFVGPSAVSFWTTSSSFWENEELGTPPSPSDSPDGDVVEKGAAAQRLRTEYATSQAARKVYTCVGCSGGTVLSSTSATEFDSANTSITEAALGVSTATDRANLIEWVRGTDNAGDETGPTTTPVTTIRPSVHGDVLHSRPAVVNYGGSTGVVLFYGANDGMLHAVNGNQSGTGAGGELWSFVPEEMFSKLNRLRENTPPIKLSTTVSATATPRDYFVDGPISVYQKLNADLSINKVLLYVGMRRGGRLIYAFDVTDPTAPKFVGKKTSIAPTPPLTSSPPADDQWVVHMPRLGETWSEPKVTRIKGHANPVLVFGGGYDAAAEDTGSPGTTTMGDRVYVLDAFTGALLKEFATSRSVVADVTLVDSDLDGDIDRAYALDLGGQVYRINFETPSSSAIADWSIYTLADLSGGTSTGRKFFFAPDSVVTKEFTALMFGSGDREKPLLSATEDHFFQIFDRNLDKGVPASHSVTVWGDLVASTAESKTTGKGCYVTLAQGEKVVNGGVSFGGQTYFGTNRPTLSNSANSCTADLGIATSYAMPLFCTTPAGIQLTGGGLPPSPVAGIVEIQTANGGSKKVPFVIGAPNAKRSSIEGARIYPFVSPKRKRVYWYQDVNR